MSVQTRRGSSRPSFSAKLPRSYLLARRRACQSSSSGPAWRRLAAPDAVGCWLDAGVWLNSDDCTTWVGGGKGGGAGEAIQRQKFPRHQIGSSRFSCDGLRLVAARRLLGGGGSAGLPAAKPQIKLAERGNISGEGGETSAFLLPSGEHARPANWWLP